ncbi:hypothetical protein F511_37725 [Dorcoceras hygrometricum]|uniref:Uncharacterized protein n=1 Tax=Dorcoceras hygrometricum TaxID=472368 RepID=A0A2Z7AD88_9LAMI|nr:hypothetical protein F511_37725 [Dorcoceras hygrometricum]
MTLADEPVCHFQLRKGLRYDRRIVYPLYAIDGFCTQISDSDTEFDQTTDPPRLTSFHITNNTTQFITLNLSSTRRRPLSSLAQPPPPPRAAPPRVAGIRSGQFDEENPFVQNSSVLLVQPDEGVSVLVVDRIGDYLPQSTEKSQVLVIPVGTRHKCQQELITKFGFEAVGRRRTRRPIHRVRLCARGVAMIAPMMRTLRGLMETMDASRCATLALEARCHAPPRAIVGRRLARAVVHPAPLHSTAARYAGRHDRAMDAGGVAPRAGRWPTDVRHRWRTLAHEAPLV